MGQIPLTHEEMHKKESESRQELDSDDADVLVKRIRAHLWGRHILHIFLDSLSLSIYNIRFIANYFIPISQVDFLLYLDATSSDQSIMAWTFFDSEN